MAENNLYEIKNKKLVELLQMATQSKGATLLLPDLQRPFKWTPTQVIRLIDSLVRGWPFGTLLLWEIDLKLEQEHEIPTRAFWQYLSTVEGIDGKTYTEGAIPQIFHLVLDGQQRLQSLILATGGDSDGYYWYDRDWADELNRERPRARYWKQYWSFAQLSLNINEFIKQSEACGDVRDINYTEVLDWVVCNGEKAMSKAKKPKNYINPLRQHYDAKNGIAEYIQFSRLWDIANRPKEREYKDSLEMKSLFDDYKIDDQRQNNLKQYLPQLFEMLYATKQMEIGCLQLKSFESSQYSSPTMNNGKNRYDDAIIQIFTRLNSGGTVLTSQEITFAWIKRKWESKEINGREAFDCFDELKNSLEERGYIKNMDELVRAVSSIWSAFDNNGNVLSEKDLLRGSILTPMAVYINKYWNNISENLIRCTEILGLLNLQRKREMVDSEYALNILWTWCMLFEKWNLKNKLSELEQDSFEKTRDECIQKYSDYWLILSSWAGRWAKRAKKNMQSYILDINKTWTVLENEKNIDAVKKIIVELMEKWLDDLVVGAKRYIDELAVDNRQRVNVYYLALWVWHRLDSRRWENSKIQLKSKVVRSKAKLHVDHMVADKKWKELFGEYENNDSNNGDDYITPNDIGNTMLLYSNFNLSKSSSALKTWIMGVHEFKKNEGKLKEWQKALSIPSSYFEPKEEDKDIIINDIKERTSLIKKEIYEYIERKKELQSKKY